MFAGKIGNSVFHDNQTVKIDIINKLQKIEHVTTNLTNAILIKNCQQEAVNKAQIKAISSHKIYLFTTIENLKKNLLKDREILKPLKDEFLFKIDTIIKDCENEQETELIKHHSAKLISLKNEIVHIFKALKPLSETKQF